MVADGRDEFEEQLRRLGLEPKREDNGMTSFPYEPAVGRFAGTRVRLALQVPPEFGRTPPSGPHVSPRILPLNPSAATHPEKVAPSELGDDWEYLW